MEVEVEEAHQTPRVDRRGRRVGHAVGDHLVVPRGGLDLGVALEAQREQFLVDVKQPGRHRLDWEVLLEFLVIDFELLLLEPLLVVGALVGADRRVGRASRLLRLASHQRVEVGAEQGLELCGEVVEEGGDAGRRAGHADLGDVLRVRLIAEERRLTVAKPHELLEDRCVGLHAPRVVSLLELRARLVHRAALHQWYVVRVLEAHFELVLLTALAALAALLARLEPLEGHAGELRAPHHELGVVLAEVARKGYTQLGAPRVELLDALGSLVVQVETEAPPVAQPAAQVASALALERPRLVGRRVGGERHEDVLARRLLHRKLGHLGVHLGARVTELLVGGDMPRECAQRLEHAPFRFRGAERRANLIPGERIATRVDFRHAVQRGPRALHQRLAERLGLGNAQAEAKLHRRGRGEDGGQELVTIDRLEALFAHTRRRAGQLEQRPARDAVGAARAGWQRVAF